MERDYYQLWLAYRIRKEVESLSKFAKRVGIPKSTLSVAFRAIEQVLELKEKELERCREELEKHKRGGFLRKLFGG